MIMIIKTISRHTHWHVQHLKTVTTATEEFWNGNLRPAGWWILWWLRPPCPSSSGPFHLQSHHSLTHSSLAAGNTTGVTSYQVTYLNQSGHREDMQDDSAEIFVQQLRELVPCCLPVHHLQPSTQSCLCILSVKQGNNKNTLESKRFPKLDPNCGTVCQLLWDSIIWRKLLRKAWRPTCSQRIRFVQTVHQWLFVCLLKAQWACHCSTDISTLYKRHYIHHQLAHLCTAQIPIWTHWTSSQLKVVMLTPDLLNGKSGLQTLAWSTDTGKQ